MRDKFILGPSRLMMLVIDLYRATLHCNMTGLIKLNSIIELLVGS